MHSSMCPASFAVMVLRHAINYGSYLTFVRVWARALIVKLFWRDGFFARGAHRSFIEGLILYPSPFNWQ